MKKGIRVLYIVFILSFCLIGCKPAPQIQVPLTDTTPRLAILSAFNAEFEKLKGKTHITATYTLNGRTCIVGELAGSEVMIIPTGVSMVNAAMMTQAVIDHFNIKSIVFSGIAGGVNPDLNIGDVVVPAQWGEYQEQLFAREKGQGWDTGWHGKDLGNYGMIFPQKISVTRKDGQPDKEEQLFWLPVNSDMLAAARQITGKVELKKCAVLNQCLSNPPKLVVGGNGVSGSTFVDNAAYRQWVWETFQADALDMETAAVAHVAYVNDIPYIAFRSLSDLAGGGPGENELLTFAQLAADNSASALLAFLDAWKNR